MPCLGPVLPLPKKFQSVYHFLIDGKFRSWISRGYTRTVRYKATGFFLVKGLSMSWIPFGTIQSVVLLKNEPPIACRPRLRSCEYR